MLTGTQAPISNLATWNETVELTDDTDGSLMDLVTGVSSIAVSVRDTLADTVVLTGSTGDGAVVVSNLQDGLFDFTFSAGAMSAIPAKTYEIGCLVTFDTGFVSEVILAYQPVLRGL